MKKQLQNILATFFLCIATYSSFSQATLISQFDFNNNLNDKLSLSTLASINNSVTGYNNGAFRWVANSGSGGGGLLLSVPDASFTEADYSIAVDINFWDVTSYRKIFDFLNTTSDNGLYYLNGVLSLYPVASGINTENAGSYYTIVLTRTGADDTTRVYTLLNNTLIFELKTKDTPQDQVTSLVGSNRVFNLFHDDATTNSEYTDSGSVRSVRVWNGVVKISDVCNSTLSYTATPSLTLCAGSSLTVSASGSPDPGFTGYYYSPSSITGNPVVLSPTVSTTYSISGDYYSTGCNVPSGNMSVQVGVSLGITVSPPSICAGGSSTLTANGATTYTWNTGSNSASVAVTPTITSGFVVYTVTGKTGTCTASKKDSVLVKAKPNMTVTTSNSLICVGQNATLTANGTATSYTWNTGGNGVSITVNPTVTTTYTVQVTNSVSCTGAAVFTQSVSTCAGVTSSAVETSEFGVFPNPNNGSFHVNLNSLSENTFIEIYNSVGQLILKQKATTDNSINLQQQSNGIYILKIVENDKLLNYSKIIKE